VLRRLAGTGGFGRPAAAGAKKRASTVHPAAVWCILQSTRKPSQTSGVELHDLTTRPHPHKVNVIVWWSLRFCRCLMPSRQPQLRTRTPFSLGRKSGYHVLHRDRSGSLLTSFASPTAPHQTWSRNQPRCRWTWRSAAACVPPTQRPTYFRLLAFNLHTRGFSKGSAPKLDSLRNPDLGQLSIQSSRILVNESLDLTTGSARPSPGQDSIL